jgi:Prp8 binding protein
MYPALPCSITQTVNIWDSRTGHQLYKLSGHDGGVVDVAWHPKQNIIASCSVDHSVILGEL